MTTADGEHDPLGTIDRTLMGVRTKRFRKSVISRPSSPVSHAEGLGSGGGREIGAIARILRACLNYLLRLNLGVLAAAIALPRLSERRADSESRRHAGNGRFSWP